MKDKVSIPLDEQEFHVNFMPSEMGKDCEVYTTIPWAMKFLDRLVKEFPDECSVIRDDEYSFTARIPFKVVKPRKPRKPTEQQIANGKRLAEARRAVNR